MAQRRVHELAKEIGVTSKSIIDKCRAEGIELKNHMAPLTAGLEATIREWFSTGEPSTAVETSEQIDLAAEKEKARKQRRRRGGSSVETTEESESADAMGEAMEPSADEPADLAVAEAETPPTDEAAPPPATEPAAVEPTAEPEADTATAAAAEPAQTPTPPAPTAPEAPAPAPADATPADPTAPPADDAAATVAAPAAPEPPPQAQPETQAAAAPATPAATPAAPPAPAPTDATKPPAKPAGPPITGPKAHGKGPQGPAAGPHGKPGQGKPGQQQPQHGKPGQGKLPLRPQPIAKGDIKPAGPQLVPRPAKLQGPRVVRVEKPDIIQSPPPRRRPGIEPPPPPVTTGPRRPLGGAKPVVPDEDDDGKGGNKKRSPRRRGGVGGRSGQAVPPTGDVIKEWRDRDLIEREQRLAAATGGSLRRHRHGVQGGPGQGGPSVRGGKVQIEPPITVKSLSAATGIKSAQIIRKLMESGTLATINQALDEETANRIAMEFGLELDIQRELSAEEELVKKLADRPKSALATRAPVVTVLGHVDHGKTSLLDRIRKTAIAAGEAGGITQHIVAYRFDVGDKHVVFLDTPGHEAFTAMRARGANMTDVVVLVVAADDGVMPQTIESINHAKAAGVPIVVALNKIDIPNANVNRVLGQLAEHGLSPREWGGNTEVIQTSATKGTGVDALLETLSLEAEILELKAEVDAPASGYVIEAKMDSGMGVLARLLVRSGTLRIGDVLLAGAGYGRVRAMTDGHGRFIEVAGPSTPIEVSGLDEVPTAGDRFYVAGDIEEARQITEDRREKLRTANLAAPVAHDLQSLLNKIDQGKATELNLIIKADVQGSMEAITGSLEKLSTKEVRVKILHTGVGGVSTGDVALAEASDALIIGFNVVADSSARAMAERASVEIRNYRIIYDIIDDIRKALEEGLTPEVREQVLGHAEVRQAFKISRVGTIAGCYVTDGVIGRNNKVRITRNNVVVEDERMLESLKRFKDDAREVRAGFECGLKIAGYDDIKEGDILEFYQKVEVARKL